MRMRCIAFGFSQQSPPKAMPDSTIIVETFYRRRPSTFQPETCASIKSSHVNNSAQTHAVLGRPQGGPPTQTPMDQGSCSGTPSHTETEGGRPQTQPRERRVMVSSDSSGALTASQNRLGRSWIGYINACCCFVLLSEPCVPIKSEVFSVRK